MDITIYQINMGRDHNRIAFEGLDLLKMYQGSDKIDSRIYDRVFEGEVDCKDLEDVYRKFNLEHPEGYKGRSLSVSDVVEIVDENGDSTFHFCDSIGFKQIDFDPYLTEEYKEDKLSKQNVILYFLGIIPVVWLGLLIAPCLEDGLIGLVQQFGTIMQNPFRIELCEDSVKAALVLLLAYGIAIGVYLSSEHNYRRREEHGSAKWGTAGSVNKKYANKDKTENKILTQNVAIGLDGRKHRRNLNVLVCGGSGAGKTRFFAKPNIMNATTSFVVLDPKGELLRDTGHLLKEHGYDIKVLDLINMEKSHCYNPFVYLQSDDDIQRLTTNLFKNTTPKGSQSNDPFWDTSASMLLSALVYYLHYEAPEDEQNFAMVMEMLQAAAIDNEEDPRPSPLDCLFADLELDRPDHIALKYYRSYHTGSAKTLKSIQITLAARLEKFNLESLAALTCTDELDLASMGEKKVALFAIIPDNDSSFNFLVSILYTQLFQQLFFSADHIHGGALPIPVHFLMDEFANGTQLYR